MAENKQNEYPNVPPLRFPEFIDEWNRGKVGDDCDIYMCKRIFADQTNDLDGVPFYKIGTIGGDPDAYISQELFEQYKRKYNYPKKGEVLITCAGTVGKAIVFDGKDAYFQDSNIVWISNPTSNLSNDFLYYFINRVDWSKLNSTTITRIYNDDLRKLKIAFPSIDEQKKITQLFYLLDRRIAMQSKLIEDLKQLKSALVDELFCGKSNWETYKYKEILHPVGERNKTLKINNVLSASQEHGMISRDELDIDIKFESSAISTYKIVQPGDYVLHLRSFQGGLAFSRITGICSPAYTILRPTKAVTYGFFEEFFMSKRFINSLRLVTYGIRDGRSINVDELLNMNISIPNMDTQRKLVQILSVFRQRLNNAQTILQKYILQKQYLLRKMFI